MKHQTLPAGIDPAEISSLFYPYVAINSETGTANECSASAYVISALRNLPYFVDHPGQLGLEAVPGDHLQRSIAWALVRGKGSGTVVLMHHVDVVEIEDFKLHKPLAFDPEVLAQALSGDPAGLDADARIDLASGAWIFGRGSADMKAGGAIQMSVLAACSEVEELAGSILLLAVPDEEHLSAGMRAAAALLVRLEERHGLDYVLMINSEPHQRKVPERGLLSGGSIGKLLPFVYVRGILAHAGKSYEGFNPLAVLGEITSRSEMCSALVDVDEASGELSPPPTWLMARDGKAVYDVSMPLSAFGCLSVLPLHSSPGKILDYLLGLCSECAGQVASRINEASDAFRLASGRSAGRSWVPEVRSFSDFLATARQKDAEGFDRYYAKVLQDIETGLRDGRISHAGATRDLVDAICQFVGSDQPLVVVGFVPPYYPSVSYHDRPDFESAIAGLASGLDLFSQEHFGQTYELEAYFTGISDLSYSSLGPAAASDLETVIARQMPLYGAGYSIPFSDIERSAMPCINIGPWGKDFHKLSERVLKEDVFVRTPALLLHAISLAFGLALAPRA
ncbi:MAG: M20/M25/M40 family metallo-hydrolase [Spirochaetia bacterium]|jgi:arginine utilization protein RocB|nr:M20/M25/M40 family metallo-hydrolase [Spirochaetia bacterium]